MTKSCSFRFDHYREMLEMAKQADYRLLAFKDFQRLEGRVVILRHDLDYGRCIENCLQFAAMEREIGATATYFVRLHSPEYNPFEYRVYRTLRRLLGMGHEVGLHFEAVDMAHVFGQEEVAVFRREKAVLEDILGIQIITASQHGDFSRYSHPDYHYFFERVNKEVVGILNEPFEDRFFKEMKYLSDSDSVWREGCFCGHVGHHVGIQLLTHPKWWYNENYHTG